MRVFVGAGYPPVSAAAIVGSLVGESGPDLNSTLNRPHPDSSGGRTGDDRSGGAAEWLNETPGVGRKANLIAFGGEKAGWLETQCLFIIHELEHGDDGKSPGQYAGLNADLKAGTKPLVTLVYDFVKFYERPNMAVAHLDDVRVPAAKAALAAWAPALPPVVVAEQPLPPVPVPAPPIILAPKKWSPDQELEAIAISMEAISPLTPSQRHRVLVYLYSRFIEP